MPELVFATNNPHKIAEIKAQLGESYRFLSLKDIGCHEEIPETTGTLRGNALQKARHVKDNYGYDCFSEDTGLEVDALNGDPGVDTAHYAGPERSAEANNAKLLREMATATERTARFRTFLCLLQDGETHYFEGITEGLIAAEPLGTNGFGYDPVFIPLDADGRTGGQLSPAEKQAVSHRARAMVKLQDFLAKKAAE